MTSRERSFVPNAVLAWLLCLGSAAVAQTASSGENTSRTAEPSQQEAVPNPAPVAAVSAEGTPRATAVEEEILVTGSRIRRKDLTTPAPVTVITREAVQASGK